jgi:hypothetical protein
MSPLLKESKVLVKVLVALDGRKPLPTGGITKLPINA